MNRSQVCANAAFYQRAAYRSATYAQRFRDEAPPYPNRNWYLQTSIVHQEDAADHAEYSRRLLVNLVNGFPGE